MESDFLIFIAEIMEVNVDAISMNTTYGECEQWDSMMSLLLIMGVEERYGVTIPIEQAIELTSLKSIYEFVIENREK